MLTVEVANDSEVLVFCVAVDSPEGHCGAYTVTETAVTSPDMSDFECGDRVIVVRKFEPTQSLGSFAVQTHSKRMSGVFGRHTP